MLNFIGPRELYNIELNSLNEGRAYICLAFIAENVRNKCALDDLLEAVADQVAAMEGVSADRVVIRYQRARERGVFRVYGGVRLSS
jgi:hypothetical protein